MIALTSMMLVLSPLSMFGAQAEQPATAEKPRITVTEIEDLRGTAVQVTSMNNRGVIVGAVYYPTSTGRSRSRGASATVYSASSVTSRGLARVGRRTTSTTTAPSSAKS